MEIELSYQGRVVSLRRGETVLEGLENAGIDVPSSCRAGACQCCLMRAVEGPVPKHAQAGIKDSLKKSGHFLACICRPDQSLACEPAYSADFRGYATIQEVRDIGPDVVLVRFDKPAGFSFVPGQFVTFRRGNGPARSYSLASQCEGLNHFDIHVRRIPQGQMSTWFHDSALPRDKVWIEGPKGDCIYYAGQPDEPLTLVATGTGIAPLYAVAMEALKQGHRGQISIYQGALSEDRLYLVDELRTLASLYSNLQYVRCVMQGESSDGVVVGDLKQVASAELTDAKIRRIYLCGDPGLVRIMKKHFFLGGVSLGRMHADPFVGTEPQTN